MKKILCFIGIIVVLGFTAYLESPEDSYLGFRSSFTNETNEEAEEVGAEVDEVEQFESYSSIEYEKEGTKIEDGYRVESYRQYNITKDEEGNVVKKVPTDNYNYLRYKIEVE
ncbi:hypothetical protein CV093_06375 [Oceanobacillus sp. 143]|uniref:Uncharacterized protein n=1 Tax=Oceanobacillus zhaokaii TaxID=2052660 RepID=A0A345PES6_9BACI|nr:hypothetical protein [Oceanobacillus zhaokaii]AXI08506.1 hypothetical protein CUC15_06055 [Oceanobacillus zhaokaii]QGS68348.1 hypothetical protein CV093_06375 [Oceanobacillus sp. 143]